MSITTERLRNLRLSKGYSQEDVAKLIGVGRTTYLKYENGDNRPTRKLKELSSLFNVSIDYLLGNTDNPTPPKTEPAAPADDPANITLSPEEAERVLDMRNASPEIMHIIDSALRLSREQKQDSEKESHG